jgi:signal transduction histidine kinase/ActR/RegA family two-component response regulator
VDKLGEITRLNLTLELVSECAGLVDTPAVVRVIGERLRWLFDFDACTLALRENGAIRWLATRTGTDGLAELSHGGAGKSQPLVEAALASGCPGASGQPMLAIAHPLGDPERPIGVLCIEGSSGYSQRDLRYLHHVCLGVGTALLRIRQSEQLASALVMGAQRDRAARDEAQASNHAKDTFLAMLGHELRNPMAAIMAAAELLRRGSEGRTLSLVQVVGRQARHLNRLIDDLLDVSRVTTGKVSLRRSVVDLRDVASKAAEMARPRLLAKSQRLTLTLPESPVLVDGDEARLVQVASNLLNNASAYSESACTVEMLVGIDRGETMLEVRDAGIGIAPHMLASIFELFVQGGRSNAMAPGGLGLGLGVSRALVELHGGTISATSEGEGRGSRFRVSLPLLADGTRRRATAGEATGSPAASTSPRRILLVDDNADAADPMGELLRSAGHEVLVVYSPAEALRCAPAFAPEVAILDIGLPEMDGYRLAQALRQRLGAAAPAMIALSGYGQQRDRARSDDSGFTGHVVKPTDLGELLAAVESACPVIQ